MITSKKDEEKLTYKGAGVDTEEGGKAVGMMKSYVNKTFDDNVLTGLGSFGGLYKLDLTGIDEPVLVSGTDGVGTKLKVAFLMDKHNTIGIDCVAMCVNDVLCQGAKPLFFLDYVAAGKIKAEKIAQIIKGVADGCKLANCALIGGETAEHPGMMPDDEYDIAGFAVGIVDKRKIITGEKIREGDKIIGIPSSGLHSNGYSLVRKVFFEKLRLNVLDYMEEFKMTVGEILLTPTKIYSRACASVLAEHDVNGIVHITGGGFYENIPRVLPDGLCAEISVSSWKRPGIFHYVQEYGNIDEREMFSTFNMGIGMCMFAGAEAAAGIIAALKRTGEKARIIGEVAGGEGVVIR